MAVASLGQLVTNLRYEVGHSSSPAAGINIRDQFVYLLNRAQEELSFEFDFPGLQVDRDVYITVGARYYNYPADMPFENVDKVWLIWNTVYGELIYGIGPEQFTLYNSIEHQRSWPIERWMHNADNNLVEVWPIASEAPAATGANQAALIRFRGSRLIPQMVDDADQCLLPATLIVLWAAAELLAREQDAGAELKLKKANEYLRRYKLNQTTHKRHPFIMGGGGRGREPRPGLDYIPMGYGSGPGR